VPELERDDGCGEDSDDLEAEAEEEHGFEDTGVESTAGEYAYAEQKKDLETTYP
jgi:hypothetical protein